MKVSIGILLVTIPYSYQRGKVIYYQRAIPADLQERCAAKRVKVKLDTENLRLAAKQIESLNREVEAGWKAMRVSPDVVPKTIKMKAADLLRDWDLSPDALSHEGDATSLFHSHLDLKRERYARGNDRAYRHADPSDYLQPHEIVAAQMLAGQSKPRLTDALDLYLKLHAKRNIEKFCKYARQSFGRMVAAIGDKVIEDTTREDGHAFVTKMLAEGLASGSIRRMLTTSISVMEMYIKEKQVNRTNPFSSIPIPDEGDDTEDAIPYSVEELGKLISACKQVNDDRRWLLAMIADTGARLAELAGLALDDIHLDEPVPYIVIKVHPWRSLKNKASARVVPLLGSSLWAAQRVIANAVDGQTVAFPRYNKTEKTNANSASAALNKWIKDTLELDHIIHELRHTMMDRLREVQCPADVRLAIGGWTVAGIGESYGQGYTLRVMAEWLGKTVEQGR
jgi:integrase